MSIVGRIAGVAFGLACLATAFVISRSGEALLPMDTLWQWSVRGLPAYVLAVSWLALGVAMLCVAGSGVAWVNAAPLERIRNWAFVAMGAAFVTAVVLEALRLYGNVAF